MVKRVYLSVFVLAAVSCGGPTPTVPTSPTPAAGPSSSTQISFTAPNLSNTVGVANTFYSFCQPAISGNDLCQHSTNPSGGQPPYHFQLGAGGGFPPPA